MLLHAVYRHICSESALPITDYHTGCQLLLISESVQHARKRTTPPSAMVTSVATACSLVITYGTMFFLFLQCYHLFK
jgi:hypothetical protein